jgi:tetratricopeptide (TPR) repeat protein
VTSMSIWRRLDWLVLAQTQFCPRLWNVSDPKRAQELLSILDYRCWLARFSGIEELFGEGLIDYSDSSWDEIKGNLDAGASGSFNRRRREAGWTDQFLQTTLNLSKPPTNQSNSSKYDPLSDEANEWRITEGDYSSWQELLVCLQRTKNYKKSLEVIGKCLRGKSRIPPVFEKLEALALLKVDQNQEQKARDMLKKYRQRLLSTFQDELLLKGDKGTEMQQGQVYSEIAAVALVDGSAAEAQDYARKALEKDKSIAGAYKTLIWASVRTGVTSLEQEDLIFTFFVSYLRDTAKANEYYSICVKKHPQVGIYKYAYAIFLQFVRRSRSWLPHVRIAHRVTLIRLDCGGAGSCGRAVQSCERIVAR